jgi:hypothetical protein
MKKAIDPTYLRTIVDGLSSGALQKDNPSALPQGLVGVYEEAMPQASQVNERKKFLEFFGVWALMKKEVSAEFVVSLLDGWSEEEVLAYIGRYSKWFNSPVSGLYTLYHERFKRFVLQKISGSQLRDINNRLIMVCNDALTRRLNDESERYALEYLSTHLLQPSLDTKERGSELKALAYSTTYWNRQIEVSKGFDWSKRLLNDMMLWASKYDDDQVIECALNKVDLHHMEQNDAPRIIRLVAENDMETALQRISTFGGNDKEGLQLKFILSMLCLMELSLLDSKSQFWRKEAIESVLKFMDENIYVDNSAINWSYFFPDFIVFRIATELSKLGFVDISFYPESKKLLNFLPELLIREQFNLSLELVSEEADAFEKCHALIEISKEFEKKERNFETIKCMDLALKSADDILNDLQRLSVLLDISAEFYKKGNYELAKSLIYEVLQYARVKIEGTSLDNLLVRVSSGLTQQGFMADALECSQEIRSEDEKNRAIAVISIEYVKNKLISEAIITANRITDTGEKNTALLDVYAEMVKQGRSIEAIGYVNQITNKGFKNRCLEAIAKEYSNHGLLEEALECVRSIDDEYDKIDVHLCIYLNFARLGRIEESLSFIEGLEDEFSKDIALKEVFLESVKNDKIEMVINFICSISDEDVMMGYLGEISSILARHARIDESIKYVDLITNEYYKCEPVNEIVKGLVQLGRTEEAMECANTLQDEYNRSMAYIEIIAELAKQDRVIHAIEFSDVISLNWAYSLAISKISLELAYHGKVIESADLLQKSLVKYNLNNLEISKNNYLARISMELAGQERARESIDCALSILDDVAQGSAIEDVSIELIRKGEIDLAVQCALGLDQKSWKCLIFKSISREFFSRGDMERSAWASAQAYEVACEEGGADDESDYLLVDLCEELIKQGNLTKAVDYVEAIKSVPNYCGALAKISTHYFKENLFDKADYLIAKAIEKGLNTIDDSARESAIIEVVGELVQQSKKEKVYECVDLIGTRKGNKERAVNKIVLALVKKGEIAEALELVNSMHDGYWKNTAIEDISWELAKQDKIDESLEVANSLTDNYWRDPALILITRELARKGNWSLAEKISNKVFEASKRHEGWIEIAKSAVVEFGWEQSFVLFHYIEDKQVRESILNGFASSHTVMGVDQEFFINVRAFFMDDIDSLKKLLLRHALNHLFFQDSSLKRMEGFHRTLNLQWAYDVKNSMKYSN